MASHDGVIAHLLPETCKRMVAVWLKEACPDFEYGGYVIEKKVAEATLLGKRAVCFALSIEPYLI